MKTSKVTPVSLPKLKPQMLDGLLSSNASLWKKIENAPKDGTTLVLAQIVKDEIVYVDLGWWEGEYFESSQGWGKKWTHYLYGRFFFEA